MEKIKNILQESIKVKSLIMQDKDLLARIQNAVDVICAALQKGNKIILCGNGGSAADAQHIAAEFVGKFCALRRSLPAICLNTNVSTLTAIANDFGYENVFLRQVQGLGQCGDVLLGFTTSGNSKNVVEAFKYANSTDITCIALTGSTGGDLAEYSGILLNVPSDFTPRIQEAHIAIGHIICGLVEEKLF